MDTEYSDLELLEIETLVTGQALIRSLVRSHRSLTRLPGAARFKSTHHRLYQKKMRGHVMTDRPCGEHFPFLLL